MSNQNGLRWRRQAAFLLASDMTGRQDETGMVPCAVFGEAAGCEELFGVWFALEYREYLEYEVLGNRHF